MATTTDEFAIPLVRVKTHHHAPPDVEARSPGRAAALIGIPAGMLALALVQGIDPRGFEAVLDRAASGRDLPFAAVCALSYAAAGAGGGVVGALFGRITRFLTKWPALAIWGVVFFASLMVVLVAASAAYHGGVPHDLAGPIVAGGALYGLLLSFSLPFRRRS